MLKLMIVDDEYIVRQGLRKTVPWEEMGVFVAGEAENVWEAVEVAERVFPDIVICDIRMPGGEGFQVLDRIKKLVPWAQFIMITAHSDREFMLQALHKGACDYLFKPARVEDIRGAVGRATEKVLEYQKQMSRDMNYQKFFMENLDILRENFLVNLVKGEIPVEKAKEDAAALKLCLDGPVWRLLVFDVEEGEYYQTVQRLSFLLESYRPAVARAEGDKNRIVALLNCDEETDDKKLSDALSQLSLRDVRLSPVCKELESLCEFYGRQDAAESAGEEKAAGDSLDDSLLEKQEMLLCAVKYHDSVEELSRLFGDFLEDAEKRGLPEERISRESERMMDTIRMLTGLSRKQRGENAAEDIRGRFAALCREIQKSASYQLDDVSGKALYYIRKQYQEDLSLEQIAAELFISSSYLSRIMKERTGHGFGYWLNYYRIREAKEKLKDPAKSIEQVAEECGYHSYRIFSKNFRSYTGKTASAWREGEETEQ